MRFNWITKRTAGYALALALLMALAAAILASAARAEPPDDGQPARSNPSPEDTRTMLYNAAVAHGIPPEILYGVAYQESTWRQFDSDGGPTVSFDGGIGIMQITDTDGYDVEKLKYDEQYNINVGAEMLLRKMAQAPAIGNSSQSIYENWFFAVWAYNGWLPGNPYPYKVYSWIATGPRGWWTPVPVNPVQNDWLPGGLGQAIPTPEPSHQWTGDGYLTLTPPVAAAPPQQVATTPVYLPAPQPPPTVPAPAPPPPPVHPADQARITANGGQVYFIERGKKRLIPDFPTLGVLNQTFGGDVTWVTNSTLGEYQDGRPFPSALWPDSHDGVLVRGTSNGTIYVMQNGQRRLLFNLDQADPRDGDFYYPTDIRILPDAELLSLPLGPPVCMEDQLLAGPPPSGVFVIKGGLKRRIPDPVTFFSSGYSWQDVDTIPQVLLDMIPEGDYEPDVQLPGIYEDMLAEVDGSGLKPSQESDTTAALYSWPGSS